MLVLGSQSPEVCSRLMWVYVNASPMQFKPGNLVVLSHDKRVTLPVRKLMIAQDNDVHAGRQEFPYRRTGRFLVVSTLKINN